jgi:hypothetical protein
VEDLGVDGTIILKCIFMMWHGLLYLGDREDGGLL